MHSRICRLSLRSPSPLRLFLFATILVSMAVPAQATFHEWRITEIFSNASGTIQFIELGLPSAGIDNESFVSGQTLTDSALGNTFTFPHNTVSVPAPSAHLLIATPGYAALSGAPAADFILPSNNFFSISGDTIKYSTVSQITFPSPNLPTDGIDSLTIDPFVTHTSSLAVNSPTNLGGQTGSINVPEPSTLALLGAGAMGLLACRRWAKA